MCLLWVSFKLNRKRSSKCCKVCRAWIKILSSHIVIYFWCASLLWHRSRIHGKSIAFCAANQLLLQAMCSTMFQKRLESKRKKNQSERERERERKKIRIVWISIWREYRVLGVQRKRIDEIHSTSSHWARCTAY